MAYMRVTSYECVCMALCCCVEDAKSERVEREWFGEGEMGGREMNTIIQQQYMECKLLLHQFAAVLNSWDKTSGKIIVRWNK